MEAKSFSHSFSLGVNVPLKYRTDKSNAIVQEYSGNLFRSIPV